MSDLVERLRNEAGFSEKAALDYQAYSFKAVLMEAADEIERLERELADAKADYLRRHSEAVDHMDTAANRDWALDAARQLIEMDNKGSGCIDTADYQLCGFIIAACELAVERPNLCELIGAKMEPMRDLRGEAEKLHERLTAAST